MKYLLDTNVCIYLIKEQPAQVIKRFSACEIGEVGVSAITVSELWYGVEKSRQAKRNRQALKHFLLPLEMLPFDAPAAEAYGKLRAQLEKRGRPIGSLDMRIAAQAIGADLTLVTNNEREFARVPGLKLENWAV